jgi:predicted Zn-dependent protease
MDTDQSTTLSNEQDVPKRSYEQSELYLYHAQILLEAKRYQDAIDYLEKKKDNEIVDKKSVDVLRGEQW